MRKQMPDITNVYPIMPPDAGSEDFSVDVTALDVYKAEPGQSYVKVEGHDGNFRAADYPDGTAFKFEPKRHAL